MSTLYRKYRPQKFSDLVGQEHLVQTLTNEIAAGTVAHAYLFSGPRGIGKTTMARLLAKAINCESYKEGKFEPCDQCSSCKEITASRNIDVIEIDAASNTGVDNVRENIIDNAQFKPTKSKYKIFIIDEVHMLSSSAFNALLKTLEEPPAHVVFVLATTEFHKLPATIVSRCQRFNFKKIPEEIMMKKLENIAKNEEIKVDKDVLKRVIGKSDGCMRDAESLLGQILSLNLKKISADDAALILPTADIEAVLQFIETIAAYKSDAALQTIDNLIKNGSNLEQFALNTIEVLRAIMIASSGQNAYGEDYSEKDRKKIRELSTVFEHNRLIRLIDSAIKRRSEIKQAPVPQLPLELLAVEFASADNGTSAILNHEKEIKRGSDNIPAKPVIEREETKTGPSAAVSEIKTETVTLTPPHPLTIEETKLKWQEMLNKLAETMPSLTFVLKMAEIIGIDGKQIFLTVPYSFHKEKVDDIKCKKAIEDCLSDLLKQRVIIACKVNEKDAEKNSETDIKNLAAEFGGEVIT